MSTVYVFPQLAAVYAAFAPWVEALLRVVIALCLMPHGMRTYFGWFRNTGMPINSMQTFIEVLNREGYRPGNLWAPVIVITELVGGPMLALGLFTRPVSIPIFILLVLSIYEHKKIGGWFWNTQGAEYPVVWAAASAYFLCNGGGKISLDHLIGWEF